MDKQIEEMAYEYRKDVAEVKFLKNQIRKETAEKFAERLKAVLNHPLDNPLHSVIDEICKEITEGKV